MDKKVIEELKGIVGEEWVVEEVERIQRYLVDETAEPVRPSPSLDVVLAKPKTTDEVSRILKLANKYGIPVFPRGGGTGLVGGCIPTSRGIILSLERMDAIEIDRENLMAVAEAGVTLGKLIEEAERAGLFFPPHPGDEGAQVGGLIACNAGGARAVRTGVMRNYVLGLEVVLPTGEILELGGRILKNNTGYNLMQLFIGSEGTLGVITKAVIRLYPRFGATVTMIVPFNSRRDALRSVPAILQGGIVPLAIEYVERDLVERSAKRLGLTWPCKEGEAFLMIILAEASEEAVYLQCEKIDAICKENGALEPLVAESRREQEEILKIRSEIYTTLKPDTVDILDVVVPPARISDFMDAIDELEKRYGIYIPVYGHAGDGNLHPHIMKVDGWTAEQYERVKRDVYEIAVKLGGKITGEHGIGAIRKSYLRLCLSDEEIRIMKDIKRLLDPNNILNPGKVIP
ncbi:MAG TPA: FAD-binding oxidoreductase [Thermofilaceae archaeon]|nr:FAD-binding oxidoreductase [Thermofilaceae archaeon]